MTKAISADLFAVSYDHATWAHVARRLLLRYPSAGTVISSKTSVGQTPYQQSGRRAIDELEGRDEAVRRTRLRRFRHNDCAA